MSVGFTDHSLLFGEVAIKNILPKSAHRHFNCRLKHRTIVLERFYAISVIGFGVKKIRFFVPRTVVGPL